MALCYAGPMPHRPYRTKGFSLVELSIVLVIIGLLTGGILVGKNILRAAQVQSLAKDFGVYEGAIMQFVEQYDGWPGDITNATDYWGTDPSGCPTNTNLVPRKETCNGDGGGTLSANAETFRAWQQLANARLIDGSYPGVTGTSSSIQCIAGVNCPATRVPETTILFDYLGSIAASNTGLFEGKYGNFLWFGVQSTSQPDSTALYPKEAYNLDLKIDDGMPGLGRFRQRESATTCVTSTARDSAEYNLRNTVKGCAGLYLLQ